MAEDDKQHYESIELLDKSFKKALARAEEADEPEIRQQWSAAKTAFWRERQDRHATRALSNIEDLDAYYAAKLAGTDRDSERAAIRLAWASAKAAYYERLYKLNGASSGSTGSVEEPAEGEDPIDAARKAYGGPVGMSGAMSHVYADPPTPITVNPRPVEVIYSEEGE